ncbi:UNVERIFIED_CONTAM: hypothetical protein FKN15_009174 [Acipenser sinensis]
MMGSTFSEDCTLGGETCSLMLGAQEGGVGASTAQEGGAGVSTAQEGGVGASTAQEGGCLWLRIAWGCLLVRTSYRVRGRSGAPAAISMTRGSPPEFASGGSAAAAVASRGSAAVASRGSDAAAVVWGRRGSCFARGRRGSCFAWVRRGLCFAWGHYQSCHAAGNNVAGAP